MAYQTSVMDSAYKDVSVIEQTRRKGLVHHARSLARCIHGEVGIITAWEKGTGKRICVLRIKDGDIQRVL